MPRPRLILFWSGALLVGVALALVAGELALRAFWPQRSAVTIGMFRPDPHAGFALRPDYENTIRVPEYTNVVRTDSEGYRIPVHGKEDDGAVRILAIGDSFTFGVGVQAEEAWPEVLEDLLREDGHPSVAVRNGGVGGFGPLRSSRLLMGSQQAWDPHVVVHAVYVGNDLEDAKPRVYLQLPVVREGRMVARNEDALTRLRFRLRVESHLYAFVRQQFYGLYQRTPVAERSRYLDPIGLADWPDRIDEVAWPAAQDAIRSIADWAEQRAVRYLVVVVPVKYQVVGSSWAEYKRRWGGGDDVFDRDRAQRVLTAFLEDEGIPYIDLLPQVRRADKRRARSFYFPIDPHWTPAGHRFAADRIRRELRQRGWARAGGRGSPVVAAPSPR